MKRTHLSILAALVASATANAAVTVVHEYHLGEAGSVNAGDNTPFDSAGSSNYTNAISGASASVATTGASAPGSTAYLDTSSATNIGWYGADFSGLATDNFAIGVFARASSINSGDIFTTGGGSPLGAFKISMGTNGWAASAHGVAWIGTANGITGSYTANQWVHLALVRQSGTTTFYIDGASQGTYGGAPAHGGSHLSVSPGGTSYFDGHIDEARVVTFTTSDSTTDILNTLQAVPEPSSTALLGLGGLALILRRRK
ncbi:MAG: LamG-like jellyroll fold domain-containing protein [Akkermansiaceae bacterium]